MINPYFDIFSLLLYVFIGIIGALFIKYSNLNKPLHVPFIRSGELLFYIYFIALFVGLAVSRKVGYNIGGTDALNYIEIFENAFSGGDRFEEQEQLFMLFNKIIRSFTANYKIYFLICYFIIVFAYIYFIKNFVHEKISYIPFILLIFPFLKSFNTLRTSLAIALFLIALVLLKKRKYLISYILVIATFFIHRMSILYILFIPFYLLFRRRFVKLQGFRLLIFFVFFIGIGYISARFIQQYVLAFQIVYSSTDLYYVSTSMGNSILQNWPMMVPYVLLFIAYMFGYNKLDNDSATDLLKILCAYDIIIMPVSLVLGMWRANEYLYLARIIMWGFLIKQYSNKFESHSRQTFYIVVFVAFLSWLIFRICSEWNEIGIMPYLLNI